jgi:pyruvate,water dikinase
MSEGWDVTSTALRENRAAIVALIKMAMNKTPTTPRCSDAVEHNLNLNDALKKMLVNAQALCEADEQQHFYAGLYLEKSREMLRAISNALIAKGLLENHDDIYFITARELEAFLVQPNFSLQYLVRRRKNIWSNYKQTAPMPEAAERRNQINGTGVSRGVARGRLFFVNGFEDFETLHDDAILCLKTPNPSFVPWFDLCNAILTENGSALSHGFIAARELGIPAITGVNFEQLKNGMQVIVDGSSGNIVTEN